MHRMGAPTGQLKTVQGPARSELGDIHHPNPLARLAQPLPHGRKADGIVAQMAHSHGLCIVLDIKKSPKLRWVHTGVQAGPDRIGQLLRRAGEFPTHPLFHEPTEDWQLSPVCPLTDQVPLHRVRTDHQLPNVLRTRFHAATSAITKL